MAILPNAENAIVDAQKLRGYVLSTAHPAGRFKAAFFARFGYSDGNWEDFERDLRGLILSTDVIRVEESRYGQKFVVEGSLTGPSGVTVQVVSVWVIVRGETVPRFVTVYPGG
ncbi:MAG: hypothetical protein O2783_05835 [Chloroflexi bacterium]|nr:hypothetical protein [Chloroflexota bacterium]